MGNTCDISGQTGVVDPGAKSIGTNFIQLWNQPSSKINLPRLTEELLQLRQALKEEAKTLEHDTT